MAPSACRSPYPFPFTALAGDDIGRSVMVAANSIFFFLLSERPACRWKHDFIFSDLPYSV